jgi:C-terminal regulatory domain of Threonine dehydratase
MPWRAASILALRAIAACRSGAALLYANAAALARSTPAQAHYRNHGADYGRVLVGMQVPPEEMPQFRRLLYDLGYPCWDEGENPAYKLFLG